MVQESLKVAKELDFEPTIVDIFTIKPIDSELIVKLAKTHDYIITVEEHNVMGGLGSAVSEVLAPLGLPCKQKMIGMQDVFGRSGTPAALLKYYGLDSESIEKEIKEFIK